MNRAVRDRIFPTVAGIATLALGLGIRATLTGLFAKFGGVALWSTLVYFLIVWIKPEIDWRKAVAICIGVSFVVEFGQMTPVPMALYEIHPLFALVFGTTFNAPDLVFYVVGSALGAAVHIIVVVIRLSRSQ